MSTVQTPTALSSDRGLLYGDSVFETIRVVDGAAPLWALHWRRLQTSLQRLTIPVPASDDLFERVLGADVSRDFVARITVSRGCGGRGYRPPADPRPNVIVSARATSDAPHQTRLTFSSLRLGASALAGLKHTGRLDHVLAAAEVAASGYDDALMLDDLGQIIEANAANVLIEVDDRWITPQLDRCGVSGVYRRWLMQQTQIEEARCHVGILHRARAMLLCNAVRGAWPVAEVAGFDPLDVDRARLFVEQVGTPW